MTPLWISVARSQFVDAMCQAGPDRAELGIVPQAGKIRRSIHVVNHRKIKEAILNSRFEGV